MTSFLLKVSPRHLALDKLSILVCITILVFVLQHYEIHGLATGVNVITQTSIQATRSPANVPADQQAVSTDNLGPNRQDSLLADEDDVNEESDDNTQTGVDAIIRANNEEQAKEPTVSPSGKSDHHQDEARIFKGWGLGAGGLKLG